MKKIILLLVLLALSIFLIDACTQQNSANFVGQGTPVAQNEVSAAAQSGQVKEFKMTANQFAFEPSTIEVDKGDKVRLVVTSKDVPHGITIPEYGINERLNPGEPVTIEFVAGKEGSFTSFCSVFCGAGHGKMKGQIIVK